MSIPDPKSVIYGLSCTCHPEKGVRYVGQTTRGVGRRMSEHRYAARVQPGRRPLTDWIQKHGEASIRLQVLEVVESSSLLNEREIHWIATLHTFGSPGLNLNEGGASNQGFKHTPEVIQKMRDREYTPEVRARMRDGARRRLERDGPPKRLPSQVTRGSRQVAAKLSEEQVGKIKARLRGGESLTALALEAGVTKGTIWKISAGRAWTHVA